MERTLLYSVFLVLLIITWCKAIESQFKIHLFRNTVQDFIDKNMHLVVDYTKFSIGKQRIGRYELFNTYLTLKPINNDSKSYSPKIEFIEKGGIWAEWTDVEFIGEGRSKGKPAVFSGKMSKLEVDFIIAPPVNDPHKIDLVPVFYIKTIKWSYDEESIVLEYEGKKNTGAGYRNQIKSWVRDSIDTYFHSPQDILERAHQAIAAYCEKQIDMDRFKGRIRLAKVNFFEDYLEFGYRIQVDAYEDSEMIHKVGQFSDTHEAGQKGIEIMIDENVINTLFYILYNLQIEFSIRDIFGGFLDYKKYFKVSFWQNNIFIGLYRAVSWLKAGKILQTFLDTDKNLISNEH